MRIVRIGGYPRLLPSKQYVDYEKACGQYLQNIVSEPIDKPVEVTCIYYRQKKIRCDLSNLMEATHDILVKYGILADDNYNIIASVDGSRVFIDKENPRTEIFIRELEQ